MIENSYFNDDWGFILKLPKQTTIIVRYDHIKDVQLKTPVLNTDLFESFATQEGVEKITSDRRDGSWTLTVKDGYNFFELDFSEFNYLLYSEVDTKFRW